MEGADKPCGRLLGPLGHQLEPAELGRADAIVAAVRCSWLKSASQRCALIEYQAQQIAAMTNSTSPPRRSKLYSAPWRPRLAVTAPSAARRKAMPAPFSKGMP